MNFTEKLPEQEIIKALKILQLIFFASDIQKI